MGDKPFTPIVLPSPGPMPSKVLEPPALATRKFNSDDVRKFLEENNWRGVFGALKQNPRLLNESADDGFTPVQSMVQDGNALMLTELLKRPDLKIGDALLHAVEKNDPKIIGLVMDVMEKRNEPTTGLFSTTHFKFYTTPLMLACLRENYTLVGFFLKNGHTLSLPHGVDCACEPCRTNNRNGEPLQDKMRRIDTYAAASSLAFVLYQKDPFDYAMSLCRYLKQCKTHDPAFRSKYDAMIDKLNEACVSLISETDTKEDIEIVLNQRRENAPSLECVFGYPLVQKAIRSNQKPFLSQAGCLSVVYDAYCGTWNDRFGVTRCKRFGRWATHTFLYPFTALVFLLSCGRFPISYKNPKARLITSFCSYITFLAALLAFTQYKEDRNRLGIPDPGHPAKHLLLVYIYSYTAGMCAVLLTDLRRHGFRHTFRVWWRMYDCVLLLVWSCTFMAFMSAAVTQILYRVDELHRVHWSPSEPQLVYEIWFTWAAIMSSVRLFYYGQLQSHFGAVTISITRCIPTILRYVVVLFIVLASFAIGLNHLYEHYKHSAVNRGNVTITSPFQMTSVFTAARYLYWAYYGYLPPESWAVVVGNTGFGADEKEKTHEIVQVSGEWMGAVYHVIELIILLKLVVAIMAVAAIAVVEEALTDWNFVRVQIWSEFFDDSRTIPPPFNLFQIIVHGFVYLARFRKRGRGPLSAWDYKYQPPSDDPRKRQQYKAVIASLKDHLRQKINSTPFPNIVITRSGELPLVDPLFNFLNVSSGSTGSGEMAKSKDSVEGMMTAQSRG